MFRSTLTWDNFRYHLSQPQMEHQWAFTIFSLASLTVRWGNFQLSLTPFLSMIQLIQINTPEVTVFKLAYTVENVWWLPLTLISLTVEPSLTLEYTFVPCLSYCRFHPSSLSASRRKCSKSSAFAARTSPSCIESTGWTLPTANYLSSTVAR